MIKFSQMPYARPDLDKTKAFYAEETECFRNAKTFEEADEAFLKVQEEEKHYSTMATIAQIRHDIDSTDAFYDEEARELAKARPMLRESTHAWEQALLTSPFRKDFEKKYGEVMFLNLELEARSFSPEIVPDMQEESLLCIEYSNLLASAQIEFEGSTYTLAQMTPFKQSKDDAQRRSAWIAEGAWYTANGEKLDESAYWEDLIWGDMAEITVPEDCVFVMGDNRNDSSDSRSPLVGPIPYSRIVGRVRSVIWPIEEARKV